MVSFGVTPRAEGTGILSQAPAPAFLSSDRLPAPPSRIYWSAFNPEIPT